MGETSNSEGYTTDWTGPEDSGNTSTYQVKPFLDSIEIDFRFPELVSKIERFSSEEDDPDSVCPSKSDRLIEYRALDELNATLSSEWVRRQFVDGMVPPILCGSAGSNFPWSDLRVDPEVNDVEKVKLIVSPEDY